LRLDQVSQQGNESVGQVAIETGMDDIFQTEWTIKDHSYSEIMWFVVLFIVHIAKGKTKRKAAFDFYSHCRFHFATNEKN
jgi:hypothetical protein